jgi:hypothetical protein
MTQMPWHALALALALAPFLFNTAPDFACAPSSLHGILQELRTRHYHMSDYTRHSGPLVD